MSVSTTLSRIAFSQIMKRREKRIGRRLPQGGRSLLCEPGVTFERVMTDNGSCYQSFAFRKACKHAQLKHIRTKPYTPKTNGKAERFIQTRLREWAYAKLTTQERAAELPRWLHCYNWHRPHGSLNSKPPISRLGLAGNNLLRLTSRVGKLKGRFWDQLKGGLHSRRRSFDNCRRRGQCFHPD